MTRRGYFIVIEGIDGCGKSTQCQKLADWLKRKHGQTTMIVHDPGVTKIALTCRQMVLDRHLDMSPSVQTLLYFAARASLSEFIQPELEQGHNVIGDRWSLSTAIYQGRLGGIHEAVINVVHNHLIRLDPDVYIVLDVPAEMGVARVKAAKGDELDRFEAKDMAWLEQLRTEYVRAAKRSGGNIRLVDGTQDMETVFKLILMACGESSKEFATRFSI